MHFPGRIITYFEDTLAWVFYYRPSTSNSMNLVHKENRCWRKVNGTLAFSTPFDQRCNLIWLKIKRFVPGHCYKLLCKKKDWNNWNQSYINASFMITSNSFTFMYPVMFDILENNILFLFTKYHLWKLFENDHHQLHLERNQSRLFDNLRNTSGKNCRIW